jgi:tetratricopeptide (TPR) repeat protein
VPLAPVAQPRWCTPRGVGWLALMIVLALKFAVCRGHEPDCQTAAATMNDALIAVVCHDEYVRTGAPAVGVRYADAERLGNHLAVAKLIAGALLITGVRGNAFRVLGQIATTEDQLAAAQAALDQAHALHQLAFDHDGLARDEQALADVFRQRSQLARALRALDACIIEAYSAGDMVIAGYCHLSGARLLAQIGSIDSARMQLELATIWFQFGAPTARNRAWVALELANIEQEARRAPLSDASPKLETGYFKTAIELGNRAQLPKLVVGAELNLAASQTDFDALEPTRRPRWLDEAEQHVAAADLIANGNVALERDQCRADILYRRGKLESAKAIYDRIFPQFTEHDDRLDVAVMQTRVALAQHDFTRAVTWANLGINEADQLRHGQPDVELQAWVLASHRAPYELLFVALARAGRLDDAVQAFDQWQGRVLHDALSRPVPAAPYGLRDAATRIDSFHAWLPAVDTAPLLQIDPARRVVAQVRATDLVALVVADGDLWRVTSGGGELAVDDLGPMETTQARVGFIDRIRDFNAAPTDPRLGRELGEALLPDRVFRTTRDTLRVVLDGPLERLPIAALRHGDQLLIAARPIVQPARLSQLACARPTAGPRKPVIVADAEPDTDHQLPDARREAQELAARLGTTAAIGNVATAAALWSAGPGTLLHVAVHGDIDANGGYLALHDQRVYALDILARRAAPELVVLSACMSAQSPSRELAGSLASAFLAAGSTQVVATLRAVSDAGAREVTSKFYARGGATDPVRALASVQAELANGNNADWPSFAVFGRDLCSTTP